VEHCAFLFAYAHGLPKERRLAIAAGLRADYYIKTLAESAEVTFFDESDQADDSLGRRLAPALS
jgi:hypothetical protein